MTLTSKRRHNIYINLTFKFYDFDINAEIHQIRFGVYFFLFLVERL